MYLTVFPLFDHREQNIIDNFFSRVPKHSPPSEAVNEAQPGKRTKPSSVSIELITDQMDELRRTILRRILDIHFVEYNPRTSPNVYFRLCTQNEHYITGLFQLNPGACLKVKVKNTFDFIILSNMVTLCRFKNKKNAFIVRSGQVIRFKLNRIYYLFNEDVDSTYFLYVASSNYEPFNSNSSLF